MPDAEEHSSAVRPKKQRATKACDECRRFVLVDLGLNGTLTFCIRRKVKCDSGSKTNGVCSNCVSSKVECKHTVQEKKRGPKVGSKRKPASEIRYLVYTILAAPEIFAPPEEPQTVRDMIVDLANYARSLETELDRLRPSSSHRTASASTSPSNSNPRSSPAPGARTAPSDSDSGGASLENEMQVVDSLSTRIEDIDLGRNGKSPVGNETQQTLLQIALAIRDELSGAESGRISIRQRRPEFWTKSPWHRFIEPEDPPYVFPPDDLMQDLVKLYFDKLHYFFPLLHRPTFERQVFVEKLHLTNRSFAGTLIVVCSLGSRHSKDPRSLFDGTESERSLGWKYFRQLRLVRSTFVNSPSLFEVQLCALSMLFLLPTPQSDAAWAMCGLGIRLAQEMGAHRKQPLGNAHEENVQRELWKRVYWALVMLDLITSMATNRPRATTEDDYDLEYPVECDDEYWGGQSDAPFVQPLGRPSHMVYWTHFIKLMSIAGYTRRSFYSVRRSEPWADATPEFNYRVLTELNTRLDHWMETTPSHLRWDPLNPDDIFFQQSMSLRSGYYWIQMHVHKSFIRPGPVSPMNFSSLAICTNAARSYIHLVETFHQRPGLGKAPHAVPPLFMSAILLLINLWKMASMNSVLDPRKDIADVYKCVELLRGYEQRFESAGRLRDVLQAIISASQIPSFTEQHSLKRARSFEQSESELCEPPTHAPHFTLPANPLFASASPSVFPSVSVPPQSMDVNQQVRHFNGNGGGDDGGEGMGIGNSMGFGGSNSGLHSFAAAGANLDPIPDANQWSSDFIGVSATPPSTSNTRESQEDWGLFMGMVDELLHSVHPAGGV